MSMNGTNCLGEDKSAISATWNSNPAHRDHMRLWHDSTQSAGTPAQQHEGSGSCAGKWIIDTPSGSANGYVLARRSLESAFPNSYGQSESYWGNTNSMTQCSGPSVAGDGNVVYIHDIAAPTITSGPSGLTTDSTPTFSFSGTPSGASFQCKIDSAAYNTASCPSPYTASSLGDGPHTFYVRVKDPGGRTDQRQTTFPFTVDATAPGLTATGPVVDGTDPVAGTESITSVNATDAGAGVVAVSLRVDGAESDGITQTCASGGCNLQGELFFNAFIPPAGRHSVELTATDKAGNTKTVTGSFGLDTGPPALTLGGPLSDADGKPLPSDASMTIQASDAATADDVGVARLEVSVDGQVDHVESYSCSGGCPSNVNASYTYQPSAWSAGPHLVTVQATDAAGNVQDESLDVNEAAPIPVPCPETSQTSLQSVDPLSVAQAQAAAVPPAVASTVSTYDADSGVNLDPSLSLDTGGTLDATGSLSPDTSPPTPSGGFELAGIACFIPTATTSDARPPSIVNGDVALYANSAPDTDTIIRPTSEGETIVESTRGPAAPQSFSFNFALLPPYVMRQLPSGGLAVVDPSQASDPNVWVPPAPGADDPTAIPDAASQLSQADYDSATAERSSTSSVVAVIPRPYVIDSSGVRQASTVSLTGPQTLTVQSVPSAKAVVMKAEATKAHCQEFLPLITSYLGLEKRWYIVNHVCVWRRGRGYQTSRKWAGWAASAHPTTHVSAQLRVVLTLPALSGGDRDIVEKSPTTVNPDMPKSLRTKSLYGLGTWCSYLQQRTRRQDYTIGWLNVGDHACWRT
jgi:hypothetical protein